MKHREGQGARDARRDRTAILADRPQQPLILKKARLSVVRGKDLGKEALLQKSQVTIGSREDNDLVLTDTTVSRSHALLEERSDGYMLRDLGSTNGTFIDGVRVREAYLSPGAVIGLGETEIVFAPVEERIEHFRSDADRFGGLRGGSAAMRDVFGILERVAQTDVTILLQGETGTGKELAARAVHEHSRRAAGAFVVFDCGAVAPNLVESELFGHERGAFTDAVRARQGAFELADGGSIFLDEIGELPLTLQPKLLRALDQREIRRVGGDHPRAVQARVIAATNRDLEEEVQAGRFREDLFYRLSVVNVYLPPLRKRKEDIDAIAEHLLAGLSDEVGKKLTGLSPEAAESLRAYRWPGNVRELKNVLARAAALSDGGRIEARHLFLAPGAKHATSEGLSGRTLEEIEKAAIQTTLRSAGGNKSEAARTLGIAPSTLYEKIKKYGL